MRSPVTRFARTLIPALLAMAPIPAQAALYDISWTGASGYSLTGSFAFDDTLLGSGSIDETDLDSLIIEGFHNGGSVGSWDWLADGITAAANFNFNFDTIGETFLTGGAAASANGQQWNTSICANTLDFGFFSGNATQGFCLADGSTIGLILAANSTLTATRITEISEPAAFALLGLGILGLGLTARRRETAR